MNHRKRLVKGQAFDIKANLKMSSKQATRPLLETARSKFGLGRLVKCLHIDMAVVSGNRANRRDAVSVRRFVVVAQAD